MTQPGFVAVDPHGKPFLEPAARAAGIVLFQLDGAWVSPEAQAGAAQAFADAFDPLPWVKGDLTARLADERERRLALLLGDVPARVALLTQGMALLVKVAYQGHPLAPAEAAAADALLAIHARYLAVLADFQAAWERVEAADGMGALLGLDVTDDSLWP